MCCWKISYSDSACLWLYIATRVVSLRMDSLCTLLGCTKTRTTITGLNQTAWLNDLIKCVSWCCPCSSMTGVIIGMSCYHMSCMPTELVSTSPPGTPHFASWWEKSAHYRMMFLLLNLELTGNMINRNTHLRLGSGMPWRSLTITFENHCTGRRPDVNGYVKAVNRKFPVGSWVLRYYPLEAQHKLGSPWIGSNQVVQQDTGHMVGIQKGPGEAYSVCSCGRFETLPSPTGRLVESRRFNS